VAEEVKLSVDDFDRDSNFNSLGGGQEFLQSSFTLTPPEPPQMPNIGLFWNSDGVGKVGGALYLTVLLRSLL
jgi:hypothetical protein